MNTLFSYLLLGLSLAAPIGPINSAQLDRGIKYGFFHSWFIGLGAMTADAFYMILVYLGVVHFLDTPFMQTFLWSFGSFVLVYTGVETIINSGPSVTGSIRKKEPVYRSFLAGFLLSISNPLTILFWLGIYGSVLAKTATTYDVGQLWLYSSVILIGVMLWDFTMAFISSSFRKFLNMKMLNLISKLSGLSLIGFGFYFGYQAILVLMG
ncbi:threonine/homoserine/homoserine lactone efflux protein [Bacillus oleivorans]|uniref:Threonine/homoserine/homoserine lactone efflux protein n=1 Tax=Bacillus oleivorans TaxID=1448271 RepID=A0A285CUI0_9BACI|nr:LysE family transporter [Bacillus oleivorans]SNX71202.1 threonine/homoserine/homoserine lactone efflux protein [Bacillus oleivorans]